MSISDGFVEIYCDKDGCTTVHRFWLTALAGRGAWDERYVKKQAEREGWRFYNDGCHTCADCVAVEEEQKGLGSMTQPAIDMAEKRKVRERDGNKCRVPGCVTPLVAVEVAHLEHKGMGGDTQGILTQANKMLCLCRRHHRVGSLSLGRGTLWIRPIDANKGTNGLCYFTSQWTTHGVS